MLQLVSIGYLNSKPLLLPQPLSASHILLSSALISSAFLRTFLEIPSPLMEIFRALERKDIFMSDFLMVAMSLSVISTSSEDSLQVVLPPRAPR